LDFLPRPTVGHKSNVVIRPTVRLSVCPIRLVVLGGCTVNPRRTTIGGEGGISFRHAIHCPDALSKTATARGKSISV